MTVANRIQDFLLSKNVDGLRAYVRQEGNSVTESLIAVLDQDVDGSIKVMAVDALGLTSDPRALRVLIGVYENSTGHFRKVAALSIGNIAANRVKELWSIPTLISIAKDSSFDFAIRQQSILALISFRKNVPQADAALKEISADPSEDFNLRYLAS